MSKKLPFLEKSILFAPMEGVTDPIYREAILHLYPKWDQVFTDFLRIPTNALLSEKKVIEHFGHKQFTNPELKKKTTFQILTTYAARTEENIKIINGLDFPHLDLNLGCPSRRVNAHRGGSFLLSTPKELQSIIQIIRKNFNGAFSVKMRTGYKTDEGLIDLLKMLESEGVDAITIHGRTRDQLYKGRASWRKLKEAGKVLTIPYIPNGDIWSPEDIRYFLNNKENHSVMIARGAMKTPWLPNLDPNTSYQERLIIRQKELYRYFTILEEFYKSHGVEKEFILKRFKGLARYLFEDFAKGSEIKSHFMRLKELSTFMERLKILRSNPQDVL